tara:strand:+ start:1081 stop:1464 length:384 start_codon:yes stop_codon:yes gene_type:complete
MKTQQIIRITSIDEPISKIKLLGKVEAQCNIFTEYHPWNSAPLHTVRIHTGDKPFAVIIYKPYLTNIKLEYFLELDGFKKGHGHYIDSQDEIFSRFYFDSEHLAEHYPNIVGIDKGLFRNAKQELNE